MWPVALSGRLPVVALVGHHPTNKLIGREPIPDRKNFPHTPMRAHVISGISPRFRGLSQSPGQVTHVLLTRSPLEYPRKGLSARLACVKHAASVRPEPGSNSPTKNSRKIHPSNKQSCCQRNPTPKGQATQIGTGLSSTLLSSQRTTTHQNQIPNQRPALGATAPTYLVNFASARPKSRRSKPIFLASPKFRPRRPANPCWRVAGLDAVQTGRWSLERPIRPAPAGLSMLPGRFRRCKSGFPSCCGTTRRCPQA